MIRKFLILVLCIALSISAGSCSANDNEASSESTSEIKNNAEQITFASAGSSFSVIRPDTLTGEDELTAAQTVVKSIAAQHGKAPAFETDFVKPGADPEVNQNEILVGRTNRSASEKAYGMLSENEFVIAVIDSRLVCVGYTPELTAIAAEVLADKYVSAGTLPSDFCEIYVAEPECSYTEFTNPVCPSGADPWIIRDGDSYYYCYSGGDGVFVNKIDSLDKITADGGVKVYTAPEGTDYSNEYWAPALHKIDGKWYIYVAADDGDNYNHRMYVLECTGDKPTDSFRMLGKITDESDKWAIDGTVLTYGGECYFIWSGWEGDDNLRQMIYIAHMSSPSTIDSERVLLSQPDYRWEKRGGVPFINEGPVALVKDDTVHIIYSASGSWCDDYCLGKLTFRGGDIMNPDNWTKSENPVFSKTDKVFGPGHCSFTTVPNGTPEGETWMIFHANLVSGSGWGGRSVWIQPVAWDGDEIILGTPLESGTIMQYPHQSYSKDKISLKQ